MEIKNLILFYLTCLTLNITNAYITTLRNANNDFKDPEKIKVKSLKYDLHIITSEADYEDSNDPNLGFLGIVKISVEFEKEIAEPFQVNLDIFETTEIFDIELYDEKDAKIADFSHRMNVSHLIINSYKPKIISTLHMKIKFKNLYANNMYGLYRSYYPVENNKKRWLLTTQFEATYARKVFPCFDKPSWKAKFNVKIEIPKTVENYKVLCNTPAKSENLLNSVLYTCSETGLPMSSYILAFTVSDFSCTKSTTFESNYPEGVKATRNITTCGRSEFIKKNEGELSQTTAKQVVEELGKYLNLGYALEKIHQIGIPDFSAGAMENWGHISYRETKLFFNEEKDSSLTKQSIILVIAHELVHQWFGNLVTLDSWDYIWLNEAFATYLSYKIADQVTEPKKGKWEYDKQFLVNEMHLQAFEADGFSSSTPMSNKIPNENFVLSYFSTIPYSKGASVLRMWEKYLGEDKFKKGLQLYIEENKEKTATPSHLFKALQNSSKMNEEFFRCWHEEPGYPVVEVKKINETHYALSQHRFLWEKSEENFTTVWSVPVRYFTNISDPSSLELIMMEKNETQISNINAKWLIINAFQEGYYRVNYEKENWKALGKALKEENFGSINEYNRAQIINDVFSLARSVYKNYVDYGTAFALTDFLKNETSLIVWKTALDSFKFVQTKLIGDEELSGKFKNHILELLKPHFEGLNQAASNHTHTQKLLSSHINRWACSLDFENCTKEAEELYKDETAQSDPDMEETILCTVIRNNNNSYWDDIFKKYKEESKSATKLMYLSALGCTNDTETAEVFLNKTLDESSGIRQQDRLHVFSSVCDNNVKNIETAFTFIEKNYEAIMNSYGGVNALGTALRKVAEKLHHKKDMQRFKTLAERAKGFIPEESIGSAIHEVSSNVQWADEKLHQIEEFFNSGSGSFMSISISLISLCSLLMYNI